MHITYKQYAYTLNVLYVLTVSKIKTKHKKGTTNFPDCQIVSGCYHVQEII